MDGTDDPTTTAVVYVHFHFSFIYIQSHIHILGVCIYNRKNITMLLLDGL